MSILLVEDDPSLREGMQEMLSELAEVQTAASVESALQLLQDQYFDVVLADLHIGSAAHGGRVVLEAARKRLSPVAIISASAPQEVLQSLGPALQPDALLTKPFQLEDMFGLVEGFLGLRQQAERLKSARTLPPVEGWTHVTDGVEVAAAPSANASTGLRELSWIRLAPGTGFPWKPRQGREGVWLVEGEIEINAERRVGPQYFFLSANQTHETRSARGCVALSLTHSPR